jgi:excisionase family DNA binding protein
MTQPHDHPTSPTEDQPAAYRPAGAARRMGISRSQLYVELAAGRLKARKHGKCTLITATEIDRWLAELPQWEPQDVG